MNRVPTRTLPYGITFKKIFSSDDVLHLISEEDNFISTVNATYTCGGIIYKDVPLVWKGIDYLTDKEIKAFVNQKKVSISRTNNENEQPTITLTIDLKLTLPHGLFHFETAEQLLLACEQNPKDYSLMSLLRSYMKQRSKDYPLMSLLYAYMKHHQKRPLTGENAEQLLESYHFEKLQSMKIKEPLIKSFEWINGFKNMINYLKEALKNTAEPFDINTINALESPSPLESLLHKDFKNKTTTIVTLMGNLAAEKTRFLQTFALNALNNFHFGNPLVIYCPLMQLKKPYCHLIRETLELYGINGDSPSLQSYPTLWIIDGLEQVSQKTGNSSNILQTNDQFKHWNSHYLVSFMEGIVPPNRVKSFMDPIVRIRILGERKDAIFAMYTMTNTANLQPVVNQNPTQTALLSQSLFRIPKTLPGADKETSKEANVGIVSQLLATNALT